MSGFECPPVQSLVCSLVPVAAEDAETTVSVAALPIAQRMRAAYWLKTAYERSDGEERRAR